jgi:DNA-binding transcriptional ArsR family regulator
MFVYRRWLTTLQKAVYDIYAFSRDFGKTGKGQIFMFRTDILPPPRTVSVRVTLAPVLNLLYSMTLLDWAETSSGFSAWITQTVQSMPADLRRNNRIASFVSELVEDESFNHDSFPAFITHLETMDFVPLLSSLVTQIAEKHALEINNSPTSRDAYLTHMAEAFSQKDKGDEFDVEIFSAVFDLMIDPVAAKTFLIEHLKIMWENYLEPEWTRVSPMLVETCSMFQQLDLNDLTPLEAIQAITGRDMSLWDDDDSEQDTLIFVPSAHIGPYITKMKAPNATAYIVFGARVPEGLPSQSTELSLREMLVQLNALADETRLHILELLTHHRELASVDFQTRLGLSQSAASRHLRQLVATGYLNERRRDLNKVFSLNPRRVTETTAALQMLLTRK